MGGITQSSRKNDISGFATQIGAEQVFPYAGTGLITGVLGAIGSSMTAQAEAGAVAAGIAAAAADSSGPINIFTFSGGAAAFKGALDLLPSDVISRIGNVTYASPGLGGELPLVNGQSPTVIMGNGPADVAATFFGSAPLGTSYIQSNCDGHNGDCELALAANRAGNACNQPSAFSAPNFDSVAKMITQAIANALHPGSTTNLGSGRPYQGLDILQLEVYQLEIVTSTITFGGQTQ